MTKKYTKSELILEQECCNIARQKKLVVLESPYAGDVEFNLTYARKCLSDSLRRGESPIASHLLYTQVLNDLDPNERKQGVGAGLDWLKVAEKQVFYTDLGWSEGMKKAKRAGEEMGIEIEERKIFE